MGSKRRRRGNPDRRTVRRYDLSLPIEVRAVLPVQAGPLRGRTRDVSTAGVYFIIDQEFTPGSELEFALTLPAEITHGTDVFIHARGKVVRSEKKTEDRAERAGVAASIEKYYIVRAEATVS